jgi:hypothetical protein
VSSGKVALKSSSGSREYLAFLEVNQCLKVRKDAQNGELGKEKPYKVQHSEMIRMKLSDVGTKIGFENQRDCCPDNHAPMSQNYAHLPD